MRIASLVKFTLVVSLVMQPLAAPPGGKDFDEVSLAREIAEQSQDPIAIKFFRIVTALFSLGVVADQSQGQLLDTCGGLGSRQRYPCSPQTRLIVFNDFVIRLFFGYGDIGLDRPIAHTILDNLLNAMEHILFSGKGVAPGSTLKTLMEQLLNGIPYIYMEWFGARAPSAAFIRDFVSLAQLLGNMVAQGKGDGQPAPGRFYAFNPDVGGGKIEIITTIHLSAFDRPVTIFANTFDFFRESRNNIINEAVRELNAAIEYIRQREDKSQNIAVGFVRSRIDDSTADSIMSQLQAGAPVLFIYCVANCDSGNPVYHLRYRGMTEQQAKALACALGFSDFCERYTVVETGPPWDGREEEQCPMAMIGSDCSNPPPADPPPMP